MRRIVKKGEVDEIVKKWGIKSGQKKGAALIPLRKLKTTIGRIRFV